MVDRYPILRPAQEDPLSRMLARLGLNETKYRIGTHVARIRTPDDLFMETAREWPVSRREPTVSPRARFQRTS